MLYQRITSKGQMHTVACLLAEDLKENIGHYGNYTVEKNEYDNDAEVLVYSDQICNNITESCIESCRQVIGSYCIRYDCVSWHFGLIELGKGKDKRVLPCIYVCVFCRK